MDIRSETGSDPWLKYAVGSREFEAPVFEVRVWPLACLAYIYIYIYTYACICKYMYIYI